MEMKRRRQPPVRALSTWKTAGEWMPSVGVNSQLRYQAVPYGTQAASGPLLHTIHDVISAKTIRFCPEKETRLTPAIWPSPNRLSQPCAHMLDARLGSGTITSGRLLPSDRTPGRPAFFVRRRICRASPNPLSVLRPSSALRRICPFRTNVLQYPH